MAFSPDGRLLASSQMHGTVRVWRLADARLVRTDKTTGYLRDVAFSPDGRTLAAAGDGGGWVWALTNGAPITRLGPPERMASKMAFTPDGENLVLGWPSHPLGVWRIADGTRLLSIDANVDFNFALSWDGQTVATPSLLG